MITFEQLWVFLLLPLPILISLVVKAYHTPRAALRVSVFRQLVNLTGNQPARGALILKRNFIQRVVMLLAWISIVTSAAQPVWLAEPAVIKKPSRDLMLAVDLSGSMEANDFVFDGKPPMNRLDGVKWVLRDFVQQRENDRLGLIVFGSAAYLQVPFSLDRQVFSQLLDETRIRMAGPKTMIGDAIGLAAKHFSTSELTHKVLILLTDGNDSGSRVPPLDAAQVAKDNGIVIHTIAVGDPAAVGEEALDIETLQGISQLTGGVFFRAQTGTELQRIYAALEKMEPDEVEVVSFRPKTSLFFWPLGVGLVLQLSLQLVISFIRRDTGTLARRPILEGVDD